MQQRDILKDQIEQLGQVLGKAVSILLGLKNDGNVNSGIQLIDEVLREDVGFDISSIGEMDNASFKAFLNDHPFNTHSLETLGDLLVDVGESISDEQEVRSRRYFGHAVTAYEMADHKSDEYSMTRAAKQKDLRNRIK